MRQITKSETCNKIMPNLKQNGTIYMLFIPNARKMLLATVAYLFLTLGRQKPVYRLCTNFPVASHAGIPALRKLPCGVGSRYTGGTVCQRQALGASIPALFSNAYWHLNAQIIEIQTRQQLKNHCFYKTQRIFENKFYLCTPSGQHTS